MGCSRSPLGALLAGLIALVVVLSGPGCLVAADPRPDAAPLAQGIDRLLEAHGREHGIKPAGEAPGATLFRRLTLDLSGRVPTPTEIDRFNADGSPNRYADAARKLLSGPEFAWHF